MIPTKFQFIWLRGFRSIFICNSIHCWSNYMLLISIFKLELSPFAQIFFFRKHAIINMNWLWRPCLLMDRDKMSNLYRGPAIDASYQVSVHLSKWFQRRRFKKKIGQSETRIAYGGHVCWWIGTKWAIFIEDLP